MSEVVEVDNPAHRVRARFNEAVELSESLKGLIQDRMAQGDDYTALWQLLQEAEAKKGHMHAELAKMGRAKILSRI